MEVYFTHSVYLIFLFLIPLMILLHWVSIKAGKRKALKFANFEAISRIKGIDLYSKNITILIASCLIVLFIVFALAGMTAKVQKTASDFSFVLAIDNSQSMEAGDLTPSRLEVAKKTARDFADLLPLGTRVGVISFSGNAMIEQEITDDKYLIKKGIDKINLTSVGGTDISESIILGVNMLAGEDSRAVIILSDGQINVGHLDESIDYANRNDVLVHSVAIGTKEGGMTSYGLSKLDEDSLKAVSYNTEGKYFFAESKEQIDNSFLEIAQFKKKNVSLSLTKYLLIASVFVFFIVFVLFNFRYRMLP